MRAMSRACRNLPVVPELVVVDGNRLPDLDCPAKAIIGGDGSEPVISAASIIAKNRARCVDGACRTALARIRI